MVMRAEKRRTKQGSEGSSQSSPQCPQARQPPVAIVGGSYAGLTAALTLKRKSIPFIVFEKRKQPFSHVQGHFSVPSYEAVAKKLEISAFKKSPSREEVIDSFLENVSEQLVCGHVMVSVDSRNGLFYLQSETETGTKQHGPFHTVIGADGVRSTVRRHALRHTYLIGDARWANERSAFDFGLHRIQQGADLALLDGIELGQAIFEHLNERSFPQVHCNKFDASILHEVKRTRQFAVAAAVAIFAAADCFRRTADTIFQDDCLKHSGHLGLFQFASTRYTILLPNPFFWLQLSVLIGIQSITSVAMATVIYYGIIQRRRSTTALLLCWGVAIPFSVALPFYLIKEFHVCNRAVLVACAMTPTLLPFRALEALFGFSPDSVEHSLSNYSIYYSSPIEFVFDSATKSPTRAAREDVIRKGRGLITNVLSASVLLSIMEACSYEPFETHDSDNPLSPSRLMNNLLAALLTCSTISTGTSAFGFVISALLGRLTMDVFDNPMFLSDSITDFWSNRWNRLVHGVLKRGVYKPVRSMLDSREFAAAATFFASGLLHEFILTLYATPSPSYAHDPASYISYTPVYGNQFLFFSYNGCLMCFEYLLFSWMRKYQVQVHLPSWAKSILVISLALPVSHWFTDEYVRSGVFAHFSVGFPIVKRAT